MWAGSSTGECLICTQMMEVRFLSCPPKGYMPFDTPLTDDEEKRFKTWKHKYAPNDSGQDYDFRGAFKSGLTPGADGHWRDTYKKPNHETFSDESIYSSLTGTKPGHWNGDKFMSFDTLQNVFKNHLQQQQSQSPSFDYEAHQRESLTTGPFADAHKRQSVWKDVPSVSTIQEQQHEELEHLKSIEPEE